MSQFQFLDAEHDRLWTIGYDPPMRTWFASREPWPPAPTPDYGAEPDLPDDFEEEDIKEVIGTRMGECASPRELIDRLRNEQQLVPPVEVQQALADPQALSGEHVERFWDESMIGAPPWRVGTESQRWDGYLDPAHFDPLVGQGVMRNIVGAQTYDELRIREDTFVGIRGATLRAHGIPATYDLDGLKAIHGHLFQDVYQWAGEVRTVNIAKGASFAPPEHIETIMSNVADAIRDSDRLRNVSEADFPDALARVYHVTNVAHPFREGNGRTQREFITALAAESGHRVDWTLVKGAVNDYASEMARQGDLGPMTTMFRGIVSKDPYPQPTPTPARLPGAITAAYPSPATQATARSRGTTKSAPYRPPSGPSYGHGAER